MATTDSKSESAIEASLEPNQRQAFRELIDDYNVAEGLHLQSWGAASIRVSLPRWSGADGGGRQIRTLGIYANKETPACIGHDA